jgi:DegV family protein with EDD domain
MNIKIVTDSTCDLPEDVIKDLGITVVPCYINLDGASFRDGVDLTREEFYLRLPDAKPHPTTSAPGTGAFIKAYRDILDEGAEGILSIHISKKLSNVANVASLAVQGMEQAAIEVFDSGNLSLGTGFLVQRAAEAIHLGKSLQEIKSMLLDISGRTYAFARVMTLEYLRSGGRIADLSQGLASMLDIKPIMKMHNGKPGIEMVRTRRVADQRVLDLVAGLGGLEQVGIVHANAREDALKWKEALRSMVTTGRDIWVTEVSPIIGSHVGPGAVCVLAVANN